MDYNDLIQMSAWAGALIQRRSHPSLGEQLTAAGPWLRGESIDRMARNHRPAWLLDHLPEEPEEGSPLLPVEADMDACRKPFQLWNVHRELRQEPFELEEQQELRLGPIAQDVVPPLPKIVSSTLELYLLETARSSVWFAQELRDLRRNRRLRLFHGRPEFAPPPTFVSRAEREQQAKREET